MIHMYTLFKALFIKNQGLWSFSLLGKEFFDFFTNNSATPANILLRYLSFRKAALYSWLCCGNRPCLFALIHGAVIPMYFKMPGHFPMGVEGNTRLHGHI
jgi:hypothetical protein